MARARNIKPSLFKNELLGEADPLLTILFAGLWCLADRDGKLEDRPRRIQAEIFPYRDLPLFNGYLTELQRLGFIDRYTVDNVGVIKVCAFSKHQAPHKTEKASVLPEPPLKSDSWCLTVNAPLINGTATVKESLIPDSFNLIPDSLKTPVADAPEFINADAWNEWLEYRKQSKKKMTPATVTKQISFLAKYDKVIQGIIINQSIQNGWAGLFEPKEKTNGAASTRKTSLRDDLTDKSWAS